MIEFTIARYDTEGKATIKASVGGGGGGAVASPWQEGATFTISKDKPFGIINATKSGNKFPVIILIDQYGEEVPLWLSMLVKRIDNPQDKTTTFSSWEFNKNFRNEVLGRSNFNIWWDTFVNLVGNKTLICHRESVWVSDKQYFLIGFELKPEKK